MTSADSIFFNESLSYEEKLRAKKEMPVRVGKIYVYGCVNTNENYLKSHFKNTQRARTLQDLLDEVSLSVERLQRNGVLLSAVARCVAAEAVGTADIIVQVVEDQPTQLATTMAIQNGKTSLETEFTKRNVFGGFENYSVRGSVGSDASNSVEVEVSKPNVLNSTNMSAKFFHSNSNNQLMQSHNLISTGAALSFYRPGLFGSPVSDALTFGCTNRNVTDIAPQASQELRSLAGLSTKAFIEHRWTRNTTNDKISPSRGSIFQIVTEIANLRDDLKFAKSQAAASVFLKPFKYDLIFGVDLQGGYIHSFDSQRSVPLPDRFLLGGPASLWGFELNSVGPFGKQNTETEKRSNPTIGFPSTIKNTNSTDAIGGNVIASGKISLSSSIPYSPLLQSLGARAQIFLNAGNLMNTSGDETLNAGFERFINSTKLAYGFGLKVPFLTGRVDLAWSLPLLSNSRDQNRFFQFGFTQSFK